MTFVEPKEAPMRKPANDVFDAKVCLAVQVRKTADSGDRTGFVFDDEAGQALIDDLGDGATVIGNDRGTR
jgi:hypothetical protein